jgi:hypothetical protein
MRLYARDLVGVALRPLDDLRRPWNAPRGARDYTGGSCEASPILFSQTSVLSQEFASHREGLCRPLARRATEA